MSPPINPNASPEACAVLAYLYNQYGKVTLTGQHDQMYSMGRPDQPSERVKKRAGKPVAIWGGEWGFSDERHDIDNIKYRPLLLEEIRRHHHQGQIIVMTYHQASPTIGEPCGFTDGVQARLSNDQFDAILSPGSDLHLICQDHIDRLAIAFQTLQSERIPIIFRPYHEMNGDWFWWGGDAPRFRQLWDLTYDRFTHFHGLNNLLWAWNPDKPNVGIVEDYFPGLDKVDLVGTDIYPSKDRAETFPLEWFQRMKAIAGSKPLALSENSEIPSPEILAQQPYAYYMCWDNLAFINSESDLQRSGSEPAFRSAPWA